MSKDGLRGNNAARFDIGNSAATDNVTSRLGDAIANLLVEDASVYISSSAFSLSAFEHLADELERVRSVRFVFFVPAFQTQIAAKERIRKERREFFIPGVG